MHVSCADCHVPKKFWPLLKTKIAALKDVWHEINGTIDTLDKFKAHRKQMAERVWQQMKDSDSRACRNCHLIEHMDLNKQTDTAQKEHCDTTDKGKSCIDCHKGVAHNLPDESGRIENKAENK